MKKYLYCLARQHEDQWEAFCLDLDIAVQGRSLEEVTNSLNGAIATYVADALKEAPEVRKELLSRSAPLSARLAWAWPFIVRTLIDRNRDGDSTIGFQVACPA
jgi:hypothetical protein